MPAPQGSTRPVRSTGGSRNGKPANAGAATRRRIITTAERLFAQRGIDAVSVRDITTAAKVNTASIHYHIGTKRDLVAAIIDTRTDELGKQRARFLEVIESMARPSVRRIAEAMVLPAAERTAQRGGGSYIGFLAVVGTHPDYADMVSELTDRHSARLLAAYAQAAPTLPQGVRAFRYALAKVMINQAYGQLGVGVHLWVDRHAPGGDVDFTERLIDAIAGLLRAPSSV